MTHTLNLDRKADLFTTLRQMVEAGEPDGPVTVLRDGKPSVTVASLHEGALLCTVEEPRVRIVPWSPHPKFGNRPGPRIQALLDARAWWNAETKKARPIKEPSA